MPPASHSSASWLASPRLVQLAPQAQLRPPPAQLSSVPQLSSSPQAALPQLSQHSSQVQLSSPLVQQGAT
eukprot:1417814-Prymnesium_polylepis.1